MLQTVPVKFKVDTAQVNILPLHTFNNLNTKTSLVKSDTKLTSYSGNELHVKGTTCLKCADRQIEFFVVDTQQTPILGLKASQELGIIKIILSVNDTTQSTIHKSTPDTVQRTRLSQSTLENTS